MILENGGHCCLISTTSVIRNQMAASIASSSYSCLYCIIIVSIDFRGGKNYPEMESVLITGHLKWSPITFGKNRAGISADR